MINRPPAIEMDHEQFEYCDGDRAQAEWGEKLPHYMFWRDNDEWGKVGVSLGYNNHRVYRRPRTKPVVDHFI